MMDFLPGNSFEVLRPSPERLIVVCPLYWLVILIAGLAIGLPGLRKLIQGLRAQNMQSIIWGAALLLIAVCATTLLRRGQVTFDKSAQTATFSTVGFLFIPTRHVVALDQVSYATMQTTAGARMFVVVFRGGARRSLSGYTSQGGQSEAAYAVNDFLGVSQNH
jgi:hypothetical protein